MILTFIKLLTPEFTKSSMIEKKNNQNNSAYAVE